MKKVVSTLLACVLALLCLAGCKGSSAENEFEKPDTYAAIVRIRINPAFDLYLDTENTVVALEPLNDDAKSIMDDISLEDKAPAPVIQSILSASKASGFITDAATLNIEIAELKDTAADPTAILNTMQVATDEAFLSLEIDGTVVTANAESTVTTTTGTTTTTPDGITSNQTGLHTTTANKATTTAKKTTAFQSSAKISTTVHTHQYTTKSIEATCKEKGYVIYTCSCGDTYKKEGTARGTHKYANGQCTVCGTSDTVNPSAAKTYTEYLGNYKETADGLKAVAVSLEGEYCVVTDRDFTTVSPDSDAKPLLEYNGKQYYSVGGGHSPYLCTITDTEIIAKDMSTEQVVYKFVLQSDGQLRATFAAGEHFTVGTLFKTLG